MYLLYSDFSSVLKVSNFQGHNIDKINRSPTGEYTVCLQISQFSVKERKQL